MRLKTCTSAIVAAAMIPALAIAQTDNVPQNDRQSAPESRPFLDRESDPERDRGSPGNKSVEAAARLRTIVRRIDPAAKFTETGAEFNVNTVPVLMVYDINADRMRLMAPVEDADKLGAEQLTRLMQANFDSALDARYALARGVLWSTFLHSLSDLGDEEFAKGLGQMVNLVATYGSSYSSGLFVFGGGDSQEEQRQLIDELEEKAKEI